MESLWGIPLIYYALAISVISSAILALTAKRPSAPPPPSPASLSDFQIPQINEGTPQVVIFGTVWIPDWLVLWYGDLETVPITQTAGGGKK